MVLNKQPMEKLAEKCPKCFGPEVPGKREDEPNYIFCMDGNFQHRRHVEASVEIPGSLKNPSLFVPPEEIDRMRYQMTEEHQESGETNFTVRKFRTYNITHYIFHSAEMRPL